MINQGTPIYEDIYVGYLIYKWGKYGKSIISGGLISIINHL